jgi:hypothetical protein
MRLPRPFPATLIILLAAFMLGCPSRQGGPGGGEPEPTGESADVGRYMFDAPSPFTDPGVLDNPCVVQTKDGVLHVAYLVHDGMSQRIWYTKLENDRFHAPMLLSQAEGGKRGGSFLAETLPDTLVAFYVNISAIGGQLLYKTTENSGRTWTLERRWNERGEVRWPVVLQVGSDTMAYFCTLYRDSWEVAVNKNFSSENEPTVDVPQGTPYNLQGLTDGTKMVWLAYFVGRSNADGGRLAWLTSQNGGNGFLERYLFDDRIIMNEWNFFRIAMSNFDRKNIIHLIFTEGDPESTSIYYSRSDDGGENFTSPVALIQSDEPLTRSPLILANDRYVLVATADAQEEGPGLRYCLSEDAGETFHDPAIATRNVSAPESIAGVMERSGSVMLVWDDLAGSPEGEQLYMLRGTLR